MRKEVIVSPVVLKYFVEEWANGFYLRKAEFNDWESARDWRIKRAQSLVIISPEMRMPIVALVAEARTAEELVRLMVVKEEE